jgi:hypothetical protein
MPKMSNSLEQVILDSWSKEEEDQLNALIKKRLSVRRDAGADLIYVSDLLEGEREERNLANILKSVEVKMHRGVARFGSVFIEVGKIVNGREISTGLSTTTAEWQAHIFAKEGFDSEVIVLIKTERLRRIIKKCPVVSGGENSRGAVVPKRLLLMSGREIQEFSW